MVKPNYDVLKNSKFFQSIPLNEKMVDENKENEVMDPNTSMKIEPQEPNLTTTEISENVSAPSLNDYSVIKQKLQKLKKIGEDLKSQYRPSILSFN